MRAGSTASRGEGMPVTPSEQYRAMAARFRAHSRLSDNVRLSAEWEHLARCYVRLAQQAEHNQTLDIAYETPARHDGDRS